ncbi:pyocin knob domain-containing protein [uncultured Chryseobacterium sp.]|uniref:pyocin knob domain-containing protein n=1 Tax=uncultured Chryseobacterium sp. TaxID=259322 RepID=UPI0025FC3EE9|nr:pyocin knob domain-containing protein [uncultured Chryseobacterium sp.]
MIAPEYFNNHIAVEGEIIVKRVPNDTGSVLVWNSATKKLSIRTHAEIVSDLNLATVNTNQLITGIKSFVTSGGNYAPFNNTLQIYADDGSLPSMTYSKGGSHVGQIMFNSDGFYFKNGDDNAFYNVKAGGFEKSNSDNNHVLLGGGGHKDVSDFASSADLTNLVTKNTEQTITADKVFKKITTTDWVIPKFLAFPDASGSMPNYIGFYMWNSQWQVNWRDSSNTHLYQLLDIDGLSKNATFYGNTTSPKFTTPGGNSDQWNEAYHSIGNYVTLNTDQNIESLKWFNNRTGTNGFNETSLIVAGWNGSKAGISFFSSGMDIGSVQFDGYFNFRVESGAGNYTNTKAAGYIKEGSSDNHFLTGDGGHYDGRKKEDDWFHSARNFPQGTLIQTDVDYSQTYGDQFLLEMKGNMYGGGNPLIANIQGYIYYDTIIARSGYSTLYYWNYIIALNLNGKLCFWFPSLSYWQGFDVKVTIGNGGLEQGKNRVVSVSDNPDPGGTKRVEITLEHLLTKEQLISGNTFWEKKNIASYWAMDSDKDVAVLNGSNAQRLLSGGILASDGYTDSQHIPAYGIHAKGSIQSDEGFVNRYYKVNQRNKIWNFGDSTAWGLSYFQGSYHSLGEGISFHFGDAGDYKFFVKDNGNIYTKNDITAGNFFNGKGLYSPVLSGGQVIHAGNSNELYLGNPVVSNVYLESGNSNLLHNRSGYGAGIIWDQHNFNPNNYIPTSHSVYNITQSEINGWRQYVGYWDNRNIQPAHLGTQKLQIGFTNWFNNGDQANHYADYLHFGGYQDGSGGNQNLVMFSKNGFGLRQFQGSWQGVSKYQSYVDYWNTGHFSQGDINAWQFNRFNTQPMSLLSSANNANNLTSSGFYQIGYGTQNSGANLGINDNVRGLLHFETENTYSASQIQTQRYEGNILSRTKADGVWSEWVRHWGNNDFNQSDINNWNSKANGNHTHLSLYNEEHNGDVDTHTLLDDNKFKFVHRISAGSVGSFNMFPTPNNANSILAIATHPGGYGTLFGINGESEIFTKNVSAGTYSPIWRQLAYKDWVLQQIPSLNNYVTLDTEQNIAGRKTFSVSTGNGYTGAPVMINGNGSTNTIFPTLAFHQPGLYAGTLSYRGNGFYFMNMDGNGFDFVRAAGYVKDGSSNQMLLLGGGSHEDKNKYIFGSNHTGTVEAYSPDTGLPVNSFKPIKSGFYRPNNENEYGSLLIWAEHPQTGNGFYGAGMAFDYSGTNAYLTGIDGAGNKTSNKKLWHSGDFTQAYVTEWINAANAGVLTNGSAVQVDGAGGINQGSGSRANKVWFDYNWAGSGRAGSVINFSGLNPSYNVELFAAYHGDSNAIGIRTRNGDNGLWSLPRWLWNSENFKPSEYYNNHKGSIAHQDNLVANGSQWISTGDTGTNFDGALANKTVEGTFANFNAYDKDSKNLGFTLMARTSTEQGIYYKTWYGGGSQTWRRLLEAGDNTIRSLGFSGGNINDYPYIYTLDGQFKYLLSQEVFPDAGNWGTGNNAWLLSGRKTIGELAWRNYGNGHTVFDISNGITPWGVNKSNKDADVAWSESYPTLVGGNGFNTYGVRVDSARNADNLGNISAGSYVTQPNLNTQLSNYATLNGIQTFTNTNTFLQSPVIPDATLGAHAVNKKQIELSTGNEGEGGQALKINGNNSVTLTNFFVTSRDGSRNPNDIAPNLTPRRVRFDFAAANSAGLGGSGNYAGIMTYSPWDGTTGSTGDSSYQLAFANQTGINGSGVPMLKIRKGIDGNWSASWYKFWTQADFTITNIQQWNDAFQNGLRLNQDFTVFTGNEVMITDNYFANESGLIDTSYKNAIACKVNEYYKFGSNIHGWEGINYHYEKKTVGIGGEADSDNKVRVEGCVKATANFKSKEESPNSIFIPDGSIADLKDEIVNEKYAIRLDPHEYELDPSGYLDIDDRNRLIHVIGEQAKMTVNFKEIYPKQQIVIYNFDQKGYPMSVLIKDKLVYNIEPGCFLRLYVTKSLRVIAERQMPSEFIW